jgi:hypothetical protein
MPQPTFADVHVSAALTNISVAYLQDTNGYVTESVFPMVPVVHQTDQYFVYGKDDFFRDEAQERADAAESAGSGWNIKTQSYSARVYALHKDIGPQVRANADPAVDIDVATTRSLMQKLLIKRDRLFAQNFLTTGVWSQDVVGTAGGTPGSTSPAFWNDDVNGDPFTDIANWQTAILQNTGYMPNRLVLSWPAYQALRKHPLVIDRIKYTSQPDAKSITPAMLAAMFDVEECVIAKAVYNSAAEGLTGNYSFIVGKHALLCYSAPEPGLLVPSAGYTFGWQGFTGLNNLGVRVSQIPMDWLGMGTIRDEAEMAFDMQIVGKDLGVFFSGIVQ